VYCALYVCVRVTRERNKIASPSEDGPETSNNRCGFVVDPTFQCPAINFDRSRPKNVTGKVWRPTKEGTMAANMYRVGGKRVCVREWGYTSCDRLMIRRVINICSVRVLSYFMNFGHYSNFSAFWRDYDRAKMNL